MARTPTTFTKLSGAAAHANPRGAKAALLPPAPVKTPSPSRTRHRRTVIVRSCEECMTAARRCDRGSPCRRCRKLGIYCTNHNEPTGHHHFRLDYDERLARWREEAWESQCAYSGRETLAAIGGDVCMEDAEVFCSGPSGMLEPPSAKADPAAEPTSMGVFDFSAWLQVLPQ